MEQESKMTNDNKCECGGRIETIAWCSDGHSECSYCQGKDLDCNYRDHLEKCLKCGKREEVE